MKQQTTIHHQQKTEQHNAPHTNSQIQKLNPYLEIFYGYYSYPGSLYYLGWGGGICQVPYEAKGVHK